MPIYAYRCDHCGVDKDVLQKLSDAPLTVCPDCGAEAFHKRLSAPAFQLKGSGWYVTDFRDSGKKPAAQAGSGDGKADSGADSGSDSRKAEPKTEPKAEPKAEPVAAGSGPTSAAPARGANQD